MRHEGLEAAVDLFPALMARFRDGYPTSAASDDWKELLSKAK